MEPQNLTRLLTRNIIALMKEKGVSQRQLAKGTKMQEPDISKLLRAAKPEGDADYSIAMPTLEKIADALSVNVGDIFTGGDPELPFVGEVSCGPPLNPAQVVEMIEVPREVYAPNRYVLKATGNSMVAFNITDGTYVVIMPCDTAEDQQDVLAQIDGAFTLKRLTFRGKGKKLEKWLMGSDGTQHIQLRDGADVKIIGVVKYSFRRHK